MRGSHAQLLALAFLPILSAAASSLQRVWVNKYSNVELAWAVTLAVALPIALTLLSCWLLCRVQARSLRAFVALSLPIVVGWVAYLVIREYIDKHILFEGARPIYLGTLSMDLDRLGNVLVVAATASASLGVFGYSISQVRWRPSTRAAVLAQALPAATFTFLLLQPQAWATGLVSNLALAVLCTGAVALASMLLAVAAARPHAIEVASAA